MVSWEYPPVVVGGLGRHVHHLSTALADAGHEVVVLSRQPSNTDPSTHPSTDEISDGVRVVAADVNPQAVGLSLADEAALVSAEKEDDTVSSRT